MKQLGLGLLLALGVLLASDMMPASDVTPVSRLMPASAQQAGWTVVNTQTADHMFEEMVRGISLSPDGTMLAATTFDGVCIVTLETEAEKCFPLPEDFTALRANDYGGTFAWSPDSRQVAFTEDVYLQLDESDLWVLDIGSGQFTNRTDDGITGVFISLNSATYPLDYFPVFAPNGDLYFFRSMSNGNGTRDLTLTLQRLAPDAQEPEQVADLTAVLPRLSVFYAPSISPDGTQIAFSVQAGDPTVPQNGLWLVDLQTGEARQLTDAGDAATGMPPFATTQRYVSMNPEWAADGAGIVFMARSTSMGLLGMDGPGQNYLYVDVATGEVTPLVDLTDFPEGEAAFAMDANGESPVLRVPRFGAVNADGTALVYMGFNGDRSSVQLAVLPLPPGGGAPQIIRDVEYRIDVFSPNSRMGSNNTALLGGWLYTFE